MKTQNEITRSFQRSGLALASLLIATFMAALANGQDQPTGDDGITASPKLRAQLNERRAKTETVGATMPMACAKCSNAWVAQAKVTPKDSGARTLSGQATTYVAKHLCEGCATDWVTTGTGKAKLAIANHKCMSSGSEDLACCSGNGSGDRAIKRIEKKIEIAPLK